MRAKRRKRTILLASTSTHHGFYYGAARYAAEHDWHVVADMIYDATIPVGWKGDGILSFVGHWEELANYVVSAHIPVVEISSVRKDLGIPCVMEDNEAIGRLGAEHLLERSQDFRLGAILGRHGKRGTVPGICCCHPLGRVRLCPAAAGKYAPERSREPAHELDVTSQMGDPHDPIATLSVGDFLL